MEERLLLEKEHNQKETEKVNQVQAPAPKVKNLFSSSAFVQEPEIMPESEVEQTPSIIEKPNYDFIEELTPEEQQKVYKVTREQQEAKPNKFSKRLRIALFGLVSTVCLIIGIVNVVEITNLQGQIGSATQEYQLNLANYLTKLGTLDTASSYNELFETTPSQPLPPSSMPKLSNWFDRICNFIAGIFGG